MPTSFQRCTHCILDASVSSLVFEENGVCNYCKQLEDFYHRQRARTQRSIDADLAVAAAFIKKKAGNAKYHCILGLSGGVDSSYTAHILVKKMGLNPLIIHFDNGWNSTKAVENIHHIVKKLNLDMVTYVINWEEFKDLQRAFLYASVLDIEMLTDNAIYGATVKVAKQYGIKCIASGSNLSTESGLPNAWRWEKIDAKNIKAIHRQFGRVKLKTFPFYSLPKLIWDKLARGIYQFYPLDIVRFNKTQAMELLTQEYQWQYYGGKHYESLFTKFYQAYILPHKFKIDKRYAHLSSLIRNGEITREQALEEIEKPLYDVTEFERDKVYVMKKLNFSEAEFDQIMRASPKKHEDYPSDLIKLAFFKKLAAVFKFKKNI